MSHKVFYPKSKEKTAGFDVATLFRHKGVKGDIGIEIEVEGVNIPRADNGESPIGPFRPELIPKTWRYHHDGSLRGQENAEYVLHKPILFSEVPGAITELWEMFSEAGSVLDESNRTSVHIHLNAQSWHLNRLTAFLALYFSVEELLTAWCGDHRVGNLFCLRAKDAPAIVTKIKKWVQNNGEHGPSYLTDNLHYAGLNANALTKFGSLEIRSLRGVTDPKVVLDWIGIFERMYKMSEDYPDPRGVVEGFSGNGALAFLENVLGPYAQTVLENIPFNNQQVSESIHQGIRLAQDLCYCRDWSQFVPMDIQPDPFGRDTKTVANSINTITGMGIVASLQAQVAAQPSPYQMYHEAYGGAPVPAQPSAPVDYWNPEPVVEEDDDEPEPEYDYYEPDIDEEGVPY